MTYLIRKFTRSKWEPKNQPPKSVRDLNADALTSCLRTSRNTLSVWEAKSSNWGDFDNILAALFVSSDGPSKADIVLLEEDNITKIEGVDLVETEATTPAIDEINKKHRDISNLTLSAMENVADEILNELRKGNGGNVKRYSEKAVLRIVKKEIDSGSISSEKLSIRWAEKLAALETK